jgi:hypothetical protein
MARMTTGLLKATSTKKGGTLRTSFLRASNGDILTIPAGTVIEKVITEKLDNISNDPATGTSNFALGTAAGVTEVNTLVMGGSPGTGYLIIGNYPGIKIDTTATTLDVVANQVYAAAIANGGWVQGMKWIVEKSATNTVKFTAVCPGARNTIVFSGATSGVTCTPTKTTTGTLASTAGTFVNAVSLSGANGLKEVNIITVAGGSAGASGTITIGNATTGLKVAIVSGDTAIVSIGKIVAAAAACNGMVGTDATITSKYYVHQASASTVVFTAAEAGARTTLAIDVGTVTTQTYTPAKTVTGSVQATPTCDLNCFIFSGSPAAGSFQIGTHGPVITTVVADTLRTILAKIRDAFATNPVCIISGGISYRYSAYAPDVDATQTYVGVNLTALTPGVQGVITIPANTSGLTITTPALILTGAAGYVASQSVATGTAFPYNMNYDTNAYVNYDSIGGINVHCLLRKVT